VNQPSVSVPVLWLLVVLGYLLGSIPFGYLLVRARSGEDVRAIGSGNIGATNVARAAGWFTGAVTFFLDAAKGFFAVWLIAHFSGENIRFMIAGGLAVLVGHIFPVWLGFVGGKGVATAFGAFLLICAPAAGVSALLFLLVLVFWRYVSLASLSAAAALPLLVYLLYAPGNAPPIAISSGTLLAAVLVIVKHRENIERLLAGTEPRFERDRDKS
jgi:glycerol-3-phosphate acyltransferase PlsY